MVDQHGLLTHPLGPALLANRADDASANRPRKGRPLESGAGFSAPNTRYIRHKFAGPRIDAYERAYSTLARRTSCNIRM